MAVATTPEHPASPDATALIADSVAFFVIRERGVPAGCGGIKFFGIEYGEIKRMYVRPQFRGLGSVRARDPGVAASRASCSAALQDS